jgi:hypothetical protein
MAMLQGAGWDGAAVVRIGRGDDSVIVPAGQLYVNERSIRFVIPAAAAPGVTRCTISTRQGDLEWTLNLPQPWWLQGDSGQRATPGGWIRVFGRCLGFKGSKPALELRRNGQSFVAEVQEGGEWAVSARVPKGLQAGQYELWVHNGTGGDSAWVRAGTVAVGDNPPPWNSRVLDVVAYGARADDEGDDSAALTRALATAAQQRGGGIVRFPRGRFLLAGSFTIPPKVLIKGAGREMTHLVWLDTDAPPAAFLENTEGQFGIEDISLYANNYTKGVYVHPVKKPGQPAGPTPANIRLRRICIRFAPFSVKQADKIEQRSRRADLSDMAVISIYGDNVKLLESELAWTSQVGFMLQGNDILCRGNVAHAEGGGWCPVGGGERIICEGNECSGLTTGVTRGGKVWFAHNKVSHQYRNDREGFTTDGPFGGVGFLENPKVDGKVITFTAKRPRDESQRIPGAVRIVDGKGAGQVRMLTRFESNRLEMDREFDIEPDQTSLLWAANALHRQIIYGNSMSDTGIAVQLFGSALDCVIAGNTSVRSGGFRAWGNETCFYVQFLGNTIAEGYGTAGREMLAGKSSINADGPWVYGFKGPTTRGTVIRRNVLENNATILLHGGVHDALVENNTIRHSNKGIVAEGINRQDGVVLRGNLFEDVDVLIEPATAVTAYTVIDSQ